MLYCGCCGLSMMEVLYCGFCGLSIMGVLYCGCCDGMLMILFVSDSPKHCMGIVMDKVPYDGRCFRVFGDLSHSNYRKHKNN